MAIALFDCRPNDGAVRELDAVWQSGQLAAGPAVARLEARLGTYLDGRETVAMSDMTQALTMALRLAGVRPGDEVVTLALNCMSSNSAVAMAGAIPIWVDVDPESASVDLSDLVACLTDRTRAVVVYHLAGYIGDLPAIRELCDRAGVAFIEDVNNALGADFDGRRAGTFGDFAVLSFYANRQLNGIEGAALVCKRPEDAHRARTLRRFGIDTSRFRTPDGEIDPGLDVPEIGVASSLSNVNATLAGRAMDDLEARIARNRANAAYLSDGSTGIPGFCLVTQRFGANGVFWVALALSQDRDRLMHALKAGGVQCSKLHQRNDVYSGFRARTRDLHGTTRMEREMLALPCGWWLSDDDMDRIVTVIRASR